MWLFSKNGFISCVRDFDDPETIHVRSRFPGDIERVFPEAQVSCTPNFDYKYRARVGRDELRRAMAAAADAIDYCNFKNAVHDGTARDSAYMAVWSAMRRHQI